MKKKYPRNFSKEKKREEKEWQIMSHGFLKIFSI